MKVVELPPLRSTGDVVAVVIEKAEVANSRVWVVTVQPDTSSPPRRRWFSDPGHALARAAEESDRLGLLLIDLREPEDIA